MSDEWVDLTKHVEAAKKSIADAPENLRGEVFAETVSHIWGDNIGQALGALAYAKKKYLATAMPYAADKKYLTRELHEWVYEYILDTGASRKEAIDTSMEIFSVAREYIEEAQRTTHGKFAFNDVVNKFQDHPTQKRIIRNGFTSKTDLKRHKTPSSQFNKLHKAVSLSNRMELLEEQVKDLTRRVDRHDMFLEVDTKLPAPVVIDPIEAMIHDCRSKGLTQGDTKSILGISLRKVKKHWN